MPAKKTCIYHIFIIWECGDDGELRQTVTLFPLGLGGSNPSTPTNVIHKRINEDVNGNKLPQLTESLHEGLKSELKMLLVYQSSKNMSEVSC